MMKGTLKFWICLGVCALAAGVRGQETIEQFAKRALTLDLATVPFGAKASEHPEFKPRENQLAATGAPTNMVWFSCAGAEIYATNFADRSVSYGFKDGRLVCIGLYLSAMEFMAIDTKASEAEKERIKREAAEKARPKQEALNKLREEIRFMAKTHRAKHTAQGYTFDDSPLGPFRFEYAVFCNPEENFFCNVTIMKLQ